MDDAEADSRDGAAPPARFEGGVQTLGAFVLAVSALVVLVNGGWVWLFGTDPPPALDVAGTVVGTTALGVVALLLLRLEEVRPSAIGLSPELAAPAVAAVGGLWVGLNATGVGAAAVAGGPPSFGYLYDGPLLLLVVVAAEQYLLVGPVEELAYRGYLQNKLVDLLGGRDDWRRVALGVAAMAVVFAAMHVPNRLFVDGASLEALPPSLGPLVVSGLLYGVVYEATRNVLLVGLLHGTFNRWLLFVDPRSWPGVLFVAWIAGGVVLLGVTVWGYRTWVTGVPARSLPASG